MKHEVLIVDIIAQGVDFRQQIHLMVNVFTLLYQYHGHLSNESGDLLEFFHAQLALTSY